MPLVSISSCETNFSVFVGVGTHVPSNEDIITHDISISKLDSFILPSFLRSIPRCIITHLQELKMNVFIEFVMFLIKGCYILPPCEEDGPSIDENGNHVPMTSLAPKGILRSGAIGKKNQKVRFARKPEIRYYKVVKEVVVEEKCVSTDVSFRFRKETSV